MTRHVWIVIAAVFVVTVGLAGRPHDEFRFLGTVVSMDTAKNALTITTKEEKKDVRLKIAVTGATPIDKDGKKVTRAALTPGTHVVVDALGDDYDSLEGVAVKIVPPPAAK